MTSAFALSYQSFVDAGFSVIPIMPRSKKPGEFVGRWKDMPGWNGLATAPADEATLAKWATWPGAGIGIVLGSRIGDEQIVAIDIDTNDPAELAALFEALPESPMVKIGARGETRLFRASPDLKTQRFMVPAPTPDKPNDKRTLLEILTGNSTRQTVMPPTLHPDGMQYKWKYGCGLTKAEDLPLFTADHYERVKKALGALGYIAAPDPATGSPDATQEGPGGLGDDDGWPRLLTVKNINRDLNNQALDYLGQWVPELGIYGTRRTSGGYEAVNTLRASGENRSLEVRKRNLKIHRSGIRDMGTDDTFTAIDLVMRFRDVSQDEAFGWLRERVPEPDDGVIINFEAVKASLLSKKARQEAERAAVRGERHITIDDGGNVIDVLTGEVLPPPPINDNGNDELPDRLTRPPGLLGAVTDWIEDTARTPNRVLSLGAAITVLGTLAGRRDGGPTNSGTALYVLCLGPTGCGKQHGLDQIERLMAAAGARDHIGPGDFASGPSVISHLHAMPLSVCSIDEFGDLLKKINGKRAASHEADISKALRSAWGVHFGTIRGPRRAGSPAVVIQAPAMSIYGVSTPQQFFSALMGADLENGTLNRFLILPTEKRGQKRRAPLNEFVVPDDLAIALGDLFFARERTFPLVEGGGPVVPVPIDWADGAEALWEEFETQIDQLRESNPDSESYYARTAEMAVRLATILAVGRDIDNPLVSPEDFTWGRDLAMWSSQKLAKEAEERVSDTETGARWAKITDRIRQAGGVISHERLSRYLKLSSRDLKDALEGMRDAGLIEIETADRADKKPGARPRFYRLTKLERAAA